MTTQTKQSWVEASSELRHSLRSVWEAFTGSCDLSKSCRVGKNTEGLNVCNKQGSRTCSFWYFTTSLCDWSHLCLSTASPNQGICPSPPYFLPSPSSLRSQSIYYSVKWSHQLSKVLLIKATCDGHWIVIPPPPPTGKVKALKTLLWLCNHFEHMSFK